MLKEQGYGFNKHPTFCLHPFKIPMTQGPLLPLNLTFPFFKIAILYYLPPSPPG